MNPGKEDVVAKIKELTGGYGCDIYIEAADIPPAFSRDWTASARWEDLWSSLYLALR